MQFFHYFLSSFSWSLSRPFAVPHHAICLSCTPLSIPLLLPTALLILNVCISTFFSASSPPFCDLFPFPFPWFLLIYLLPLQTNPNPANNYSSRSSCEARSHGRCTLCRQYLSDSFLNPICTPSYDSNLKFRNSRVSRHTSNVTYISVLMDHFTQHQNTCFNSTMQMQREKERISIYPSLPNSVHCTDL